MRLDGCEDRMATRRKRDPVEGYVEWSAHRYDPGYFVGGRFPGWLLRAAQRQSSWRVRAASLLIVSGACGLLVAGFLLQLLSPASHASGLGRRPLRGPPLCGRWLVDGAPARRQGAVSQFSSSLSVRRSPFGVRRSQAPVHKSGRSTSGRAALRMRDAGRRSRPGVTVRQPSSCGGRSPCREGCRLP